MGSRPRRERCNLGHMAIQPTLSPQTPLVASHGRPRGPHVPPWTPLRWAPRRCQLLARPWTPIHRRHRAPEGYASQDSVAFWSHGAARSLVPVHARPGGRLRRPHGGLAGGQGRGALGRAGLGASVRLRCLAPPMRRRCSASPAGRARSASRSPAGGSRRQGR